MREEEARRSVSTDKLRSSGWDCPSQRGERERERENGKVEEYGWVTSTEKCPLSHLPVQQAHTWRKAPL